MQARKSFSNTRSYYLLPMAYLIRDLTPILPLSCTLIFFLSKA